MLAASHFIIGSAVGRMSGHPLLAAFLGFATHFLADMVPHWDLGYGFRKNLRSYILVAIDLVVGLAVIIAIGYFRGFDRTLFLNVLIGGFFGLVPDFIGFGAKILKIKPLEWYVRYHEKLHWFIKEERPPLEEFRTLPVTKRSFFFGLLWQGLIALGSLYILWL